MAIITMEDDNKSTFALQRVADPIESNRLLLSQRLLSPNISRTFINNFFE